MHLSFDKIFCSNTLYGHSDRTKVDISMFSHLYPESNTPFSSPHFFPIKHSQDILFKLLTLSTNSVTKKIIIVRTVYFYNSGLVITTKIFATESVLKVRREYPGIIRSGKIRAGIRCITFWVKMKLKRRNLYLRSLKTSMW